MPGTERRQVTVKDVREENQGTKGLKYESLEISKRLSIQKHNGPELNNFPWMCTERYEAAWVSKHLLQNNSSFSSEKVIEANVGREKSFSFLQDQKNFDHIKKSLSKRKPGEVVSPLLKAIRKSGLDSVWGGYLKSSSSSLQGIYCFSHLKKSSIFSNDFLINNSSICIKLSALPKCFCICIS